MNRRIQITAGAAILYPVLYFLDSTGWFYALVPAVFIHEAGHALAVRGCGARITRLRVEITGLCLDCAGLLNPRQEILCAAAAPMAGLARAAALSGSSHPWAQLSCRLSLGLSLFNLMPVPALDGGKILAAWSKNEKLVQLCGYGVVLLTAAITIRGQQWFLLAPLCILVLQLKA